MDLIKNIDKKCYIIAALAILVIIAAVFIYIDPSGKITGRPDPVDGLAVYDATYDSVSIKWDVSPRAEKYIVYRSENKLVGYDKIKTVRKNDYTDPNLDTGKEYWYRVKAVNSQRKSKKSNKISMTPRLAAPDITAVSSGDGILIKIEESPGADGYIVYRDGEVIARGDGLEYLDDDTKVRKASKYTVTAYIEVDDKEVTSASSRAKIASRSAVRISLKDFAEVPELVAGEKDAYSIAGIVKSNATISKIMVGVAGKDNDEWVSKETRFEDDEVNKKEYDINVANDKIAMYTLPAGEYRFMVVAEMKDGSTTTLKDQGFKVRELLGGELITKTARECAWPYGTPVSKYKYSGGQPTQAYREALDKAYGSRKSWSKQAAAGASCDVFVGTVVRASGVDTSFPRGLDEIANYCKANPGMWEEIEDKSEANLKPGDVIYQLYKGPGGHTCIYVGDGMVAQAHHAAHNGTYGEIGKMKNNLLSPSKCTHYYVFRSKK